MKRRTFIRRGSGAALMASALPLSALSAPVQRAQQAKTHICIFSKHLQWLNYQEMAQFASEIGFDGIDLTVRNGGHVLPENVKRHLPLAVNQIRDAGLEVPMITTGIKDPDDPYTHDILETAGKLGIKAYRPGWYKYKKGVPVQESLENAREKLTGLQAINEVHNIAASYQNHAGLYVGSSGWDLLHILEGLDPRWIGVQFDIRHAMAEGPATWPVFLEILAPYINTLDIKDFTFRSDGKSKIKNVPMGEGMVPWKKYLEIARQQGVSGDLSIHYEYPMGGAEKGSKTLGISREEFTTLVEHDLHFLQNLMQS